MYYMNLNSSELHLLCVMSHSTWYSTGQSGSLSASYRHTPWINTYPNACFCCEYPIMHLSRVYSLATPIRSQLVPEIGSMPIVDTMSKPSAVTNIFNR